MVPVPTGVSGLPGSDPTVGGGCPTEPSDQGGPPLRVAACYSRHVHQQVYTHVISCHELFHVIIN